MCSVGRSYVPYGNGEDYAFGMGGAEQAAYDPKERYAYTVSEQGYVNVIDWGRPMRPKVVPSAAFDFDGSKLTDVDICGDMIAIAMANSDSKTKDGKVKIYSTVKRFPEVTKAKFLETHVVGPLPDMLSFNSDCTKIAVANEGEGVYDDADGLTDPEGSVSIITVGKEKVTTVSLTDVAPSDAALIAAGVHLPLSLDAMKFFDSHSNKFKSKLDFTKARAAYTPATQLEPEYLAWSSDGKSLYVNLQENSAIVTVNVTSGKATSIKALPTKDWSEGGGTEGIDTVKDDDCKLEYKPGFVSMRNPDAIVAVSIDGTDYILTADEGDDKEYGDFEEKQKFKDVIDSATLFESDFQEYGSGGHDGSALANAHANFGGTKMAITIGSTAIDYSVVTDSNPYPKFKGAVGFGGRGISIWKAKDMSMVWDSGSMFEKEQCKKYPWAHNAIQDEEFAAVNGTLYMSLKDGSKLKETIDEMNDPDQDGCSDGGNGKPGACPLGKQVDERSLKDGAGPEAIVVGKACGRLLAVTATEKQGTAFVFDITDITKPTLQFLHHLSPASEKKNPSVAYADEELGEIDPESITFVNAEDSPNGNAGVMFAGAWSSTMTFYEFTDKDGKTCSDPNFVDTVNRLHPSVPGVISGMAIFAAVVSFISWKMGLSTTASTTSGVVSSSTEKAGIVLSQA